MAFPWQKLIDRKRAPKELEEVPLAGPYYFYKGTPFDFQNSDYVNACDQAMLLLEARHHNAYARAFERCPELKEVMQEGINAHMCAFIQKENEKVRVAHFKPSKAADYLTASNDRIRVVTYQFQKRLDHFLDQYARRLHTDVSRVRHVIRPDHMIGGAVVSCIDAAIQKLAISPSVFKDYLDVAPDLLAKKGLRLAEPELVVDRLGWLASRDKKQTWIDRCEEGHYSNKGKTHNAK